MDDRTTADGGGLSGSPPTGAPRARRGAGLALKLAIAGAGLAIALLLASRVGWAELGERLAGARPLPVAAALALLLGRYLAWQARWALAAARTGTRTRFALRMPALMASVLANHATPWLRVLGGIFRARYLARGRERAFARQYGVVLFDQLVHHVSQTALTWTAAVVVFWDLELRALSLAAGAAGVAVALAVLGRARRDPARKLVRAARRAADRAGARSARIAALAVHGREAAGTFTALAGDAGLWARLVPLSALFVACNAGALWLLFRAVGSPIGPLEAVAVVGLGAFAGVAVGSPGGVGTTEAAMIAGFAALGVERVDAVAATVLYRGLHYLLVLGLGGPSLAWLELGPPARVAEARSDPTSPG